MTVLQDIKSQAASIADAHNHLVLEAVQRKLNKPKRNFWKEPDELDFWRSRLFGSRGEANRKAFTFLFARSMMQVRRNSSLGGRVSNFDWCNSYFDKSNSIEHLGDMNTELGMWARVFDLLWNSSRTTSSRWKASNKEITYKECRDLVGTIRAHYDGFIDKETGMTPKDMFDAISDNISRTYELWEFPNKNRMEDFDEEATYALTPKT